MCNTVTKEGRGSGGFWLKTKERNEMCNTVKEVVVKEVVVMCNVVKEVEVGFSMQLKR